jgi:hypothetical protein
VLGETEGEPLGELLGDSLGDSLGLPLGELLGAALGTPLGDTLGLTLGDALGDTLGAPLGPALGAALGVELDSELGDALNSTLDSALIARRLPVARRLRHRRAHNWDGPTQSVLPGERDGRGAGEFCWRGGSRCHAEGAVSGECLQRESSTSEEECCLFLY